jgi:hypothetical protein
MKDFKCPICGGPTEKIWENATKTKYGMRCIKGHKNPSNKSDGSLQYSVIIVSSKDPVK